MKQKHILIALICVLALVLAAGIGMMIYLALPGESVPTQPTTVPTEATTLPTETTAPVETTQETTVPVETTVETTAPTEPQPIVYTLTFAGDCTLANLKGRTGSDTFIGRVGEDYAYPFADVQQYFATDDCTFINLEGPLTERGTPADKKFVFRGPTSYVNILTQGSVEFANLSNNHTYDYGKVGMQDTIDTLKAAGVQYTEYGGSTLFTTESGLTIGVYTENGVTNSYAAVKAIKALKDQGAEVIVACFHWGSEYHYRPSNTQKTVARDAIDAGADIVYGHHPHVLQKVETYGDGIIFYSLANFSFGGNTNPTDKDTAIIQQQIIREPDGTVHMGEMTIIPCSVSGEKGYNDYQPVPYEVDSEEYKRVLTKLDGTFPLDVLKVSYRDDLFPDPTDPTDSTDPTEGTVPGDVTEPTEPADTPTDAPETPTEAPETPTEAPETPTEAPETPTEAPETPTEAPTDPPAPDSDPETPPAAGGETAA